MIRPTTIPRTKRQTVQNKSGQALERAYIYLLPSTWEIIKQMCAVEGKSSSQVLEQLVLDAKDWINK